MIPLGLPVYPISLTSIAATLVGAIAGLVVLFLVFRVGFQLVRWLWSRLVGIAPQARPVLGLIGDVQRIRRGF